MTEDIVIVRVSIGSKLRDRAKLEAMMDGIAFGEFVARAIKQAVDKASVDRVERNRATLARNIGAKEGEK